MRDTRTSRLHQSSRMVCDAAQPDRFQRPVLARILCLVARQRRKRPATTMTTSSRFCLLAVEAIPFLPTRHNTFDWRSTCDPLSKTTSTIRDVKEQLYLSCQHQRDYLWLLDLSHFIEQYLVHVLLVSLRSLESSEAGCRKIVSSSLA